MSGNQFPTKRNPTNFTDHQYYGPLIDSYVKSILKSGLLLDEDLEVLLSVSEFRNFPEKCRYRPSISLLASVTAGVGLSLLAKKLKMPLLLIPSTIVSASFIILEFKNEKEKQENREVINRLLEVLNKIQKLNINIIRYIKTRNDLGKNTYSLVLYGKHVEEFMKVFSKNNTEVLGFLIENLKTFITYSSELCEDFAILEHLNLSSDENFDDTENCLAYTKKIHDIYILVFSKLLGYIGVLFNSQNLQETDLRTIISKTLPNIERTVQRYHDITKNQFISLRHSAKNKSEIKLQGDISKRKNISTKLEATMISSVNNLSVILEKSQNILERLENESDAKDVPGIGKAIVDVRNHTFATYESLDLLCRLYGILSNSNISHATDRTINKTFKANPVSSETVPTVSYDDSTEPVEEKFELYIGDEESTENCPTIQYEDQSGVYLSLMLLELKQSLKQHERFVAAKNRRGSEDDEEIELEKINSRKERRQSPPKFDLRGLSDNFDQSSVSTVQNLVNDKLESNEIQDLPAPPPPPLPSFSLNDLQQETGHVNARSMLDNIKALSYQRNIQEDVFGDSDEDSIISD